MQRRLGAPGRRIGRRRHAAGTRARGNSAVEKVIYLLWNETGRADADQAARLLGPVTDALLALDPAGLAIDVADAAAAAVTLPLPPPPDDPGPFAEVSIWLACHDDI